ncbi:DUF3251 domain-containing protein [Pectobacterium quasiaquaticum]|uniref:DUF3251 domain-containing protein n=1 Tax=Pectobacterium quasiaquaticum TaxID=2774015 RepID=A0A9Q2ETY7_9GAMM|nr:MULTISPECIES: DUF3251 domain-containing protein [Pectobacterium]MBE5201497.1 DUF3251 domain-containing protein [Pectobacterium quasiaquaticum]MBE5210854.1 DUF3251 domain-containing protein [Pectobacterium quasiaquaticum]MBE5213806.1 DUF3251 domain-containing protein [Pectobacterium quasiaquaticum]MBE5220775.1 DUF3251 domain-containing protein [Pectobacterium quasiaquaticum]MBE5225561.1 DUF3251 domain-containing protein [Pectobacterium quasiaquaticum]
MRTRYRVLTFLPALLLLAGCSEQRQMPKLQNQIGQLNQQLQTLTDQATALERQNALNSLSTSGIYLLPAAQTSTVLESSIGRLNVSLRNIETEANGTSALLHIRTLDAKGLPTFGAQLDWGRLDPVSGKPLTGDTQTQSFVVSPTLLPKAEAIIELRLSGLSPEELGFVRLHQVQEIQSPPPVATTESP